MRINKTKTKVMKIGKGECEQLQIKIDSTILKQVQQFRYQGCLLAEDGHSENEAISKNFSKIHIQR